MSGQLRIAYHTGEYPRATDTWIQREIEGLRRAGVDVHSFAARRTSDEHMVGSEVRAERNRTTYLVPALVRPKAVVAHAELASRSGRRYLGALGLTWRTRRRGIAGTLRQLVYFAEAGVLAHELRRRRISHLHNHFGDSSCTVAMLASAIGGSTYSVALHGPASYREAAEWFLAEKVRRAAFCVVISRAGRQRVLDLVGTDEADRVHIVHCGVEPELGLAERPSVSPDGIVYVGRVVESKGIGVLLAAIEQLAASGRTARLDIIGDGEDREALERQMRCRGLSDVVVFCGYRSRAEVARMVAGAAVLVLPSLDEGVPVTLIEAMALGTAVVATDVGDVRELVEPGVTGLLVASGDPKGLADAIAEVLDDTDLRARLASAGRSLVAAEYGLDEQVRRLVALFAGTNEASASPAGRGRSRGPITTRRPSPSATARSRSLGGEPA